MTSMVKRFSALAVTGAFAMIAATGFTQQSQAQEDASERASRVALEEVLVKGTKRDAASQSVPISVSAISGQQLKNTFRTDIWAVSDLAPNVTITQMAGFRAVAGGIRGTGANSILVTQDTSVPLIVDEFGLNSVQSQFIEFFDIEQIEIYRGPQGTLFGKNSTGGAIVVTTKRPVMNEFSADVEFQLGMFDSNNAVLAKGRFAINIPVVEDKIAIRISTIYDYDDGYYSGTKPSTTGAFDDGAGNLIDVGPGGFPNNVPVYAGLCPGGDCGDMWPTWLDTTAQRNSKHIGGTDVLAANFKVLFTPTDNYEALFSFKIMRDRSESTPAVNDSPRVGEVDPFSGPSAMLLPLLGFGGIPATGGDPLRTAVDNQCAGGNQQGLCIPSGHLVSVEGYHLHQTLELETVTLKLLTGYRSQKESLPSTYTGEAFNSLFDSNRSLEREQIQLEARAITNLDGRFNFVAGAVYSEDNVDFRSFGTLGFLGLLGLKGIDADGRFILGKERFQDPGTGLASQDRSSYAFYLDGTAEVTDDINFTAGIRYTKDKKDYQRFNSPGGACTEFSDPADIVLKDAAGDPAGATLANCLPGGAETAVDLFSNSISRAGLTAAEYNRRERPLPDSSYGLQVTDGNSWDKITWRAVVDYNWAEDRMAYLSFSTGFISGGYTETCSTLFSCQPFNPESNWNLEAGMKAQFADGKVQTNLSAFYTRFSDLVRSQVIPFTDTVGNTSQETINFNAGKSEVYGLEIEAVWLVREDLRVDFTGAYTKHDYIEFDVDSDGDGIKEDLSDLIVPFSPEWQFSLGLTYDMVLGNGGSVTWNTVINYQSEVELSVFNSLYTQMEERWLWDLNITWRDAEEKYRVTLYGKNMLNEIYRTGSNSVAGLWNMTNYGRPREYGFDVGFYF